MRSLRLMNLPTKLQGDEVGYLEGTGKKTILLKVESYLESGVNDRVKKGNCAIGRGKSGWEFKLFGVFQ